jgi:hypothetical protein
LDTIFGRKTAAVKPKIFNQTINPSNVQKPRKNRCDAKHDVKFRLSPADKQVLKLNAMNLSISLTAFASHIIESELIRNRDYNFYSYDNSGLFVHVMLDNDNFEMVKALSIKWDVSFRKVIHRIIKEYIWRSKGGIIIKYYND